MQKTICKLDNLHLLQGLIKTGKYDLPKLQPYNGKIPDHLIAFNEARKSKDFESCVHFFLYDEMFNCVWNRPECYYDLLKKFKFVAGPDFSVWIDMPIALQAYKVYQSRLISASWQRQGINVIPLVSWSNDFSYDFCFDGIEGGAVIVSTIGVMNSEYKKHLWKRGAKEMINRIKPHTILIYGKPIGFDFGDIVVKYYEQKILRGGNNYGR